ncbi:amino acid permease [Mesorhizobium sp. NZP2077]|uniref:amino acid permease n=1 Tax=Mesorhizobium sp. NZP2077 TaxID=2483404 RepID=UPI0015564B99|nr:amino acid permease [Mesorhizobium sp. NZP2077]QKC82055.1 amino acid permease [Mesorhizobium sp. NZP2077]QKD15525.1 amino acid permease [Mesorhizobium sp. NZP2077]
MRDVTPCRPHPRTLGWAGTTALAMGGSNQSLFLIAALFVGQGNIPGQGSAAVPLLVVGLLLSWAAAPAWTELVLMWPNRVGGISAACAEAFRPYSPVLSALTGTCYWWGWVPTCGLTAVLSASAIQQWYLPGIPVEAVACALIGFFTAVNLCGIKWVVRLAMPIATFSAMLAFLSSFIPVISGAVDWRQATDFTLTSPFAGLFGNITSVMAGLYLIGFAAPAFEAAACHVGETIDPNRNIPRAMLASAGMAGIYFFVLPVVWLGVLGPGPLGTDLAVVLGPTFAPLLGSFGKAAAIWFIMLNMFHGTLQPLAGAARTLAQLSEDGLLPRFLASRTATDCPWAATLLTAGAAIGFMLCGYPLWMIAAANFTYLISICMPNIAVWLLRRDHPDAKRPFHAPRGTIVLGLGAAAIWLLTAVLGFQQFGLPTVLFGLALAYSGAALYAWRAIEDRHALGLPLLARTLHLKLTGAMLFVLVLDGAGYFLAISSVSHVQAPLIAALEDIFVVVALLTISVGLVLPGMITHSASEVTNAAKRLTSGTLKDFSLAMAALGRGDLDAAHASVNILPVRVNSRDELGEMAESFNLLQDEVKEAAHGLDEARENMHLARTELMARHQKIEHLAHHDTLTGLANRTSLASHLARTLEQARASHSSFAVLSIDLDHFKEANDVFGHAAGDDLLCAISRRLEAAAPEAFIARMGGDEFTLILSMDEQPAGAQEVADRLFESAAGEFEIRRQHISIGLSIGAAIYPRDGENAAALLANADAALYRAKADGRRMLQFFDPEMDRRLRERYALQRDLRSAIAHGELVLHYQPQARIDGEIFGFEALARWHHPRHGLVSPTAFVPLAEQDGTIVEIGEWTLRQACKEAASWAVPLQIAVNLSPVQFRFGDLVGLVHSILYETGLTPGRLELEITEGVLIRDRATALSVLRRLKALGVRISMDDFGTGYASLSSLQAFPFDKIKIDRSFVSGVNSNAQSAAIVRTILSLGNALTLPVIAEGVETEDERVFLMTEGCPEIQGYLVGHPHPIALYEEVTNGLGTRSKFSGEKQDSEVALRKRANVAS